MHDFEVISPKTTQELLNILDKPENINYKIGAGYTDLINDFNINPRVGLTVINLDNLKDESFRTVSFSENGIRIGALVTASQIIENELIRKNYTVLWEAADSLASRQIRAMATIGGNVCTASPSGDMSCALVALKAVCEITDSKGNIRVENISSFFRGVKKTSLEKNEVLKNIFIPANNSTKIKSGYIKVGTRRSMEIAIASIAYHYQFDEAGNFTDAGFAIGAVAPTIMFTTEACEYIKGKKINTLNEENIRQFVNFVKKYAKPISDIRASAWYREEVLVNLSETTLK